jgi:hypothetical protein
MYEIGKVYVWRNATGRFAYLSGLETTVTGPAQWYEQLTTGRVFQGQPTDSQSREYPGSVIMAERGDLVPKDPPTGERSVYDLFKLPTLV